MLKLLLRSIRFTSIQHLDIYLQLATARDTDSEAMVKILLDRLTSAKRHTITRNLLLHAIYRTDTLVFDDIVHWVTGLPAFHGRLSLLESCFEHASSQNKTTNFLSYPAPHKRPGLRSTLTIAPPHHFGKAYERNFKAKFLTLEPKSQYHRYRNCAWVGRAGYCECPYRDVKNSFTVREKYHRPHTLLSRAVAEGL
jgi:hypothetical protein